MVLGYPKRQVKKTMEPRLKADVWVKAQLRLCDLNCIPMVISKRGDADAGSVLLKLDRIKGGIVVYSQARTADGKPAWMKATGPDPVDHAKADDYIRRQIDFDPDLWVIEIEDPDGRYTLEGVIIE